MPTPAASGTKQQVRLLGTRSKSETNFEPFDINCLWHHGAASLFPFFYCSRDWPVNSTGAICQTCTACLCFCSSCVTVTPACTTSLIILAPGLGPWTLPRSSPASKGWRGWRFWKPGPSVRSDPAMRSCAHDMLRAVDCAHRNQSKRRDAGTQSSHLRTRVAAGVRRTGCSSLVFPHGRWGSSPATLGVRFHCILRSSSSFLSGKRTSQLHSTRSASPSCSGDEGRGGHARDSCGGQRRPSTA